MKVKTYCINKGQNTQYFGLMNAEDGTVLYYAPNYWKTEKGAYRWAKKHGYIVDEQRTTEGGADNPRKGVYI